MVSVLVGFRHLETSARPRDKGLAQCSTHYSSTPVAHRQGAQHSKKTAHSISLYTGAATAWLPCLQSAGGSTLGASTTAQPAAATAALSAAHFHCCQQQQDRHS